MALKIKFGTYDISGDANVDVSDWEHNSNNRVQEHHIARRDGGIINLAKFSPAEVTLKGRVSGSSASAARTNWDTFLGYLRNKQANLYLFDDRYIKDAQVHSLAHNYSPGCLSVKFSLTFISGKPFWLAATASQDVKVISSSPTQWAITMAGNAYAKPKITIAADQGAALSNISFENVTGSKTFSYLGTVAIGDSLVIDCDDDELTAENDGADDIANFTGHFWELLAGSNTVKYTGQNCTITTDWNDRWF